MKEIILTKNKVALVDDDMYEYINQWKWTAQYIDGKKWYAERKEGWPIVKKIYMHRQIMGVTDSNTQIDHYDNDGLNNQVENLRICTRAENIRSRGKHKDNTSGYKGVTRDKRKGKYMANLMFNHKKYFLGYFSDPIEAAHAYDKAAKKYHGEFAKLNFE